MQVKNFEDLEIWKDARALTKGIYQLTRDSRFSKDFALPDQIRRAAVSIIEHRRRVRAERQSRIYSVSVC